MQSPRFFVPVKIRLLQHSCTALVFVFILLCTPYVVHAQNLLRNAGFETVGSSGSTTSHPNNGYGGVTAASDWGAWNYGGGTFTTSLVNSTLSGGGTKMLRVATGASEGAVYQYPVNNASPRATAEVWVNVRSGSVGIQTTSSSDGSGDGFDIIPATNGWKRLALRSAGAINQLIIFGMPFSDFDIDNAKVTPASGLNIRGNINFDAAPIGRSMTIDFQVALNPGSLISRFSDVRIIGINASDYTIVQDDISGRTFNVGEPLHLKIRFRPSALNSRIAYLHWVVTDIQGIGAPNSEEYQINAMGATYPEVTSAVMTSADTLTIKTTRTPANASYWVNIAVGFNGQYKTAARYFPSNDQGTFTIKLSATDDGRPIIPRFTKNQQFDLWTYTWTTDESWQNSPLVKNGTIYLPVILVPGVQAPLLSDHPNGGEGTFPEMEQALLQASQNSLNSTNQLGEGYRKEQFLTGYPTLFTLSYDCNNASFLQGALNLSALITDVKSKTYADKVNLVAHSKGGLVSRKHIQTLGSNSSVNQLIMCQTPHLGSVWAKFSGILGVDYSNLYPVYSYYRRQNTGRYISDPNMELLRLNRQAASLSDPLLPSGIQYTIIYSTSVPTPLLYTQNGIDPIITFAPGDGIVPLISQIGQRIDGSNPDTWLGVIPAFGNVPITYISIDGAHANYLARPDVQNTIFSLLNTGRAKRK